MRPNAGACAVKCLLFVLLLLAFLPLIVSAGTTPPGGWCSTGADCTTNNCVGNQCMRNHPPAGSCTVDNDCGSRVCIGTPLHCDYSHPLSGKCEVDGDCGSNSCSGGFCQYGHPPSGTCKENIDCGSRNCTGNICRYSSPGEVCEYNVDCYNNNCQGNKCQLSGLGGSCERNRDADCEPQFYCSDTAPYMCAGRLVPPSPCNRPRMCTTNKCDVTCQKSYAGEPCYVPGDCYSNNCLSNNLCDLSGQGEQCRGSNDCEWALWCNPGKTPNACDKRKPFPSTCSFDRECTTGKCDKSISECVASGSGELCFSNGDCRYGFACTDNACHAPGAQALQESSPIPILGNWISAAGAAIIVAFLLVALAYMIGMGFRYPLLEQWAKTEFWEAALSAMMLGAVIFLVWFLTDISYLLAGMDHFTAANNYLSSIMGSLLVSWGAFLRTSQLYGFLSSFSFMFFWPIPLFPAPPGAAGAYLRIGTSLSLFGGWGPVLQGVAAPLYMVYFGILANMAQAILLRFSQNNALTVFLPLGLLFRAFPLTRKIGGTVIALALALYFVFPLTLALNKPIFDMYNVQGAASIIGNNPPPAPGGSWDLPSGTVKALTDGLARIFLWIVMIIFLLVLDIIITITAFRAIAEAIGGDPQIFGMGRLGI